MPQSQTAVLRLVALDTYHSQLVAMMLALLNPRLGKSWSTSELAGADAVLVDVDTDQGRRHVEERRNTGLARRTIALGNASDLVDCRMLPKPLRLHPLLSTLSAIEAESASGASAGPHAPAATRFSLRSWPELDARTTSANELRVFAMLSRQPLDASEIAQALDLEHALVVQVITRLDEQGCLLRTGERSSTRAADDASGTGPQRGLIALLRRRFGL